VLNDHELLRENSRTRLISETVERRGPLTQVQISKLVDVTISCACKCLMLLEQGGYVRRVSRAANQKGSMTGKLPWLYARTVKPLPEIRRQREPAVPGARDLRDVVNAIICGRAN
jgi:DeoR/GlpR family transcriptional regulator of sugar metabolism